MTAQLAPDNLTTMPETRPLRLADFQRRIDEDMMKAFGMQTSQLAEARPPLTADLLMASMRELQLTHASIIETLIVFTTSALEKSSERLFPASRHRSARIHKKLIKRFGGEFRYVPCMWKVGNVIYAHEVFRKELELRVPIALNTSPHSRIMREAML